MLSLLNSVLWCSFRYKSVSEYVKEEIKKESIMTNTKTDRSPLKGSVVKTFFGFVVPSTLSLLAISTASIVDGFFVGNFIGAEALASVNLLMPYFSLLFGLVLMLAVGGSIKAGIAIGRGEFAQASAIFSQIFFFVFLFNIVVIPISLVFSEGLFSLLGASKLLFPIMQSYFNILAVAMLVQLSGLVLYYFFRADNQPVLGMYALLLGAATNIVLDAVFIYGLHWGIEGAAWATLIAQMVQLIFILRYFRFRHANLRLVKPVWNMKQIGSSAFNGLSEFINEISIGLVILVFHWIINIQSGIQGIAAFSVINYLIFISLMVYYGIVDAMHVLLSQNFGVANRQRILDFMVLAGACIGILSLLQVASLYLFQDLVVNFFLDDADSAKSLTEIYVKIVWPLFLFNGFNVLICAYLTSAEKALHSSILATLRSLVLPLLFAATLTFVFSGHSFIYALPLAEAVTFVLAVIFLFYYSPGRLIKSSLKVGDS